uniref:RNA cytidine acetyltransferase n=2 Tax=Prasinoderma coloniale TaxID=156133 RepID=A0A7R9TSQ7_9VIRI|eukprot:PRCOL_00004456-RA
MRKKVDARIRTLVENGVKSGHRSVFVVVGDRGREQVVNLHYMLSKASVKARPSVLWCYKKELYLSSHRKKRMRQIRKLLQRGLLDAEKEDPFSLFMASTNIRYTYYNDSASVLGQTFGMCVLQDFESLTPNLLARTIETVEGGGVIVLLLSTLTSLRKLYSMSMDVHARYRTEAHTEVVPRFNERFILSLADNRAAIVMDDELNILPLSSHVRALKPSRGAGLDADDGEADMRTPNQRELADLQLSLADTQPAGSLLERCKTLDQARALLTFLDAASERTLRSTVALTAARGRGKSAALGLAVAGALGLGYSNVFVTAPTPENLKTLFDFIVRGLEALGWKEHIDYTVVESTNPDFNKAVVRINVFRDHRQTVQYVLPQHHERLAQAELLVIDEAAAIPLPVVKALLGPYLVFLSSTVNGYEGTGRALSLKLMSQLRSQATGGQAAAAVAAAAKSTGTKDDHNAKEGGDVDGVGKGGDGAADAAAADGAGGGGRVFKEVTLEEPIRYAEGDPTESWLSSLLCLDAAKHVPRITRALPSPDRCELYYVNRDTLFSYHAASEVFLQRMIALYVSSHYKNTPNDLQLMSDAPAHQLFVLLAPVDETVNALPDILAVVQVCLEGQISKASALKSLERGALAPHGDLIPWTVSNQFRDGAFAGLSGARIVRIATHPDLCGAGYGSRAAQLLERYYAGAFADPTVEAAEMRPAAAGTAAGGGDLRTEKIAPRTDLGPLLVGLPERAPEEVHWLGVSYGLTQQLFNFWSRQGYMPVYVRQTPSDVTGEHTCIMCKPMEGANVEAVHTGADGGADATGRKDGADNDALWLAPFVKDFRARYASLLASSFRGAPSALALSVMAPKTTFSQEAADRTEVHEVVSPYDMKRLEAYSRNLADYRLVMDLVPPLARAYVAGGLPVSMTYIQATLLLGVGLQHKSVEDVAGELDVQAQQALALFSKALTKLYKLLDGRESRRAERALPRAPLPGAGRVDEEGAARLEEDLEAGAAKAAEDADAREARAEAASARKGALSEDRLREEFGISADANKAFDAALKGGALPGSGTLSVKASAADAAAAERRNMAKKRKSNDGKKAKTPGKKKKKGAK